MPWPKLTPLQSRFAASLAATLLLIILYFALSSPHLAYAADVDAVILERHGSPDSPTIDIYDQIPDLMGEDVLVAEDGVDIEGRAAPGTEALANNVAKLKNIKIGETQYWVFPKEALHGQKSPPTPGLPSDIGLVLDENINNKLNESEETSELDERGSNLSRRITSASVYITANTCLQPDLNATRAAKDAGPPQLELYVSTSKSIDRPGPSNKGDSNVIHKPFDGGYVVVNPTADGDIYISISAPNNTRYSGIR
ncbi:hypothetical protein FQN49_005997 [Arthroderma sp. PD_2]|nr:hypothetical protein FQN49_005997 [Arthroderma sp. PD_2]